MSNSFNIRPTNFSWEGGIFLGEASPPLVTGLRTSIHHEKQTFSCVLYAHFQFLCSLARIDLANQGLRQPVKPHTFNVFDETLAQPHFAVVNCSDVVGMSVFHSPRAAWYFCSYELLCRNVEFTFLRRPNLKRGWFIFSAMTHQIRGVDVERYAYYVTKRRQNVGLETWKWRQIVTSQTAQTKYKWPPYDP